MPVAVAHRGTCPPARNAVHDSRTGRQSEVKLNNRRDARGRRPQVDHRLAVDPDRPVDRGGESLGSLERAVAVLDLFATTGSPTLGVTEIARQLTLPKAVVHRILSSLRAAGYVNFDEGSHRYRLGSAVLRLGAAYLRQLDVRDLARGPMEELSEATHETSTLSIRSGWTRVYVHQVVPRTDVRMEVELGRPYPLHAGSSSKAFLAYLSEPEIDDYLARPLVALTPNTIVDPEALRREVALVRARGFAVSRGERQPDAASVAAPILDANGRPVAVMSVCGPIERFQRRADNAAGHLLEVTRSLSGAFGYTANGAAVTSISPVGGPTGSPSR